MTYTPVDMPWEEYMNSDERVSTTFLGGPKHGLQWRQLDPAEHIHMLSADGEPFIYERHVILWGPDAENQKYHVVYVIPGTAEAEIDALMKDLFRPI